MHVIMKSVRVLNEEVLQVSRQLGLTGFQLSSPDFLGKDMLEYDKIMEAKKLINTYGLTLDMIENVPINQSFRIFFGLPGRDEQIENYICTIRNMGRAEIPVLGFNFMPSMIWRTSYESIGRGGSEVALYDKVAELGGNQARNVKILSDKRLDAEGLWANYEYFIKAVIPEAESSGVCLALHPDDPPTDDVVGTARIFNSLEGFIQGMQLADSPNWGINLCLGSISSMSGGEKTALEFIRTFGPVGKLMHCHFRNVVGHVPLFRECYIDEGNFNPARVISSLHQANYRGPLCDDHAPHMQGDDAYGFRSRCYAVGYVKGLLKMMEYKI